MKDRISTLRSMVSIAATMLFVVSLCGAASIPAWLDDGISDWNKDNAKAQIQFVDIKDEFVWYMIPETDEIGHKEIRGRVYAIVMEHGYKLTADEELVTTGKPPTPVSAHIPKKCWKRSFVLDIKELSDTRESRGRSAGLRQRMLTSQVCEDSGYYYIGFRIVQ